MTGGGDEDGGGMDRAELELFSRSVASAAARLSGDPFDAALRELGWHDALAVDARAAVSVLFTEQGRACATSSGLSAVLRHAVGVDGGTPSAVVLPALGSWDPAGSTDGDRLAVRGISFARFESSVSVLVVGRSGDKEVAFDVPVSSLSVRSVRGIDPSIELVDVTGSVVTPAEVAPVHWPAAVALGRLALAHELVGASRRMLELARDHALERIQFGKPISAFQAVRHRLADTLIAIETAEAGLDAAWLDGSVQSAAMAKALAGRGARVAARHCQQVLAGIGFTTEHPLHRYVRRVLVLDEAFGSARVLTKALGDELLRTRALPPLLPL